MHHLGFNLKFELKLPAFQSLLAFLLGWGHRERAGKSEGKKENLKFCGEDYKKEGEALTVAGRGVGITLGMLREQYGQEGRGLERRSCLGL